MVYDRREWLHSGFQSLQRRVRRLDNPRGESQRGPLDKGTTSGSLQSWAIHKYVTWPWAMLTKSKL